MNKKIFILFLSILSISLISALPDQAGNTINFDYPTSTYTNYSEVNTNFSEDSNK